MSTYELLFLLLLLKFPRTKFLGICVLFIYILFSLYREKKEQTK